MLEGTQGTEAGERALAETISVVKKRSAIPFFLLLAYLLLDYGRPQEMLRFLRVLRLPGITIALLAVFMIAFGNVRLGDRKATLFVLLLGLMAIHGPIAVNNYWALMVFIEMTMNFVVFLALTNIVDQPEKYDRLVRTWLGIHLLLAVVGIMKGGRGIGGFFSDENDFCMVINMVIPFSFFLAMNASGKKRLYFIALTGLFLFVVVLTKSRGGFVGLCASMFYCWLKTNRKVLTASILGFFAVVALFAAPSTYWDEVRSITEEGASKGTGAERIYTWNVGWHMFLANPILGVGQGNFPYVFGTYEAEAGHGEEGYHGRSVAGRAAHSIYFTMLPELGIVGTGLFIAMVFNVLKDLKTIKSRSIGRKRNESGPKAREGSGPPKNRRFDPLSDKKYALALALEGALVSYLVSGAFISVLYYPCFWVLMGFVGSLKKIAVQDSIPVSA